MLYLAKMGFDKKLGKLLKDSACLQRNHSSIG